MGGEELDHDTHLCRHCGAPMVEAPGWSLRCTRYHGGLRATIDHRPCYQCSAGCPGIEAYPPEGWTREGGDHAAVKK
jgi:hypothetical protein